MCCCVRKGTSLVGGITKTHVVLRAAAAAPTAPTAPTAGAAGAATPAAPAAAFAATVRRTNRNTNAKAIKLKIISKIPKADSELRSSPIWATTNSLGQTSY